MAIRRPVAASRILPATRRPAPGRSPASAASSGAGSRLADPRGGWPAPSPGGPAARDASRAGRAARSAPQCGAASRSQRQLARRCAERRRDATPRAPAGSSTSSQDRRGQGLGVARLVRRDGPGGERPLDHRQARRDDRLAHRPVLEDLRREAEVGERGRGASGPARCRPPRWPPGRPRSGSGRGTGRASPRPSCSTCVAQRRLGVAPAVDVERDGELGPAARGAGRQRVDDDVQLVGRREGAGVDEAQRRRRP